MRLLLIEDEKGIVNFLKPSLEAECFAVDVAPDGARGEYLALTNDYDLIILDNILPQKSGREVCEALRNKGKSVPILMLSVKSETTSKVDLLNAGADDYMTKPFSLSELLARIRALLRRPKALEGERFALGDILVDGKKHLVKRGEHEIYLTRKEFMLLEYLLRNHGSVVSRGMIMEHVWDMNADPFSNTIESHIRSLRRKLETPRHKFIQTIPGRGYKITG